MGVDVRRARRWTFADCVFDESNWTLVVRGQRVAIETKPLEMLRELLLAGGELVTKDELLDRIWTDVHVVEASLTTAVHKLRHAIGDDKRQRRIIETVSGLGYRLSVPAEAEIIGAVQSPPVDAVPAFPAASTPSSRAGILAGSRWLAVAGGLGIATAAVAIAYGPLDKPKAAAAPVQFSQKEAAKALREMDIPKVERMLAAGWNANMRFDTVGTTPITYLIQVCEWDRAHDQRKMLNLARTLIDGGADIEERNVFGDTAYSIAKAKRYCGPDHPVTQMLEAICYGGDLGPKDLCLATYELTADQRRAQGLPPKA